MGNTYSPVSTVNSDSKNDKRPEFEQDPIKEDNEEDNEEEIQEDPTIPMNT